MKRQKQAVPQNLLKCILILLAHPTTAERNPTQEFPYYPQLRFASFGGQPIQRQQQYHLLGYPFQLPYALPFMTGY
jgi:hypothetical protein